MASDHRVTRKGAERQPWPPVVLSRVCSAFAALLSLADVHLGGRFYPKKRIHLKEAHNSEETSLNSFHKTADS